MKLQEMDSKVQAVVILVNRLDKKITFMRKNDATALRSLRKSRAEVLAQNMTLKQQLAELIKFQ